MRLLAACRDEPAKLNQVNAPLARFDLRDPAMGHMQNLGEFALGQTGAFAGGAEFGTQDGVFAGMCRFFH